MSKLSKIKEKLASMLIKMGAIKTDKAVLMWDGDEDLKAGIDVFVEDGESGERKPADDGEYVTEDEKTIVVKGGKVESINDPKAEVDAEDEAPKEDDAALAPKFKEVTEAIDGLRKEINELYKIVDSILDKIGETRKEADERLSKIEKMSSAQCAKDEMENTLKADTNGDKKLENFKRFFE